MRANPNRGLKSATLNALDHDPGDNPPKESLMATRLQRDNFELSWAIYMQAKTGHETPGNVKRLRNDQQTKEIRKAGRELRLESINTNQVARVNKATIRSELSSMRWHNEIPSDQDKAGKTPHTLHKRRPQEKIKSQASYKAEQLVKNAMVSEDIKDDWLKLIQEEDILARDAKAFMPRVQEEEKIPFSSTQKTGTA